ncbi:hypothetical protein EVAR_102936_1 [Eumeta japonica]|uniref:Uncharacterized protein n=1 Tax=Eumeta variegata TaxID=151549 RepID=A0A4C1UQW0_EUMVA|nr:hypothetical protein EVAR_102936_1 [Eumeta japonica]
MEQLEGAITKALNKLELLKPPQRLRAEHKILPETMVMGPIEIGDSLEVKCVAFLPEGAGFDSDHGRIDL